MSPPNQSHSTEIRPYGKAAIAEAARLIQAGLPVAMPTETVYGLAADATNADAVARIYAAKGRPSFNPLIVHVRDLDHAKEFGSFGQAALRAAELHWPGPLTIVVPLQHGSPIAAIVTAGLETVAIRCPAHAAMQALLHETRLPLAAPSANASGGISPTSAAHVMKTLAGRIPLIVDGGRTEQGIESTIVSFYAGGVRLLRSGPIAVEATNQQPSSVIEAPGQLASHYAPRKPLRMNVTEPAADEWMIGFGSIEGDENLSAGGDLVEAAARLFDAMHRADDNERAAIAVAPIPSTGIGEAINDRLSRAAAPRSAS